MKKGKQECQNGTNNLSKQQNVYQNGKKLQNHRYISLKRGDEQRLAEPSRTDTHKSVKSNNAVILSAKLLFFFHISKQFDLFISTIFVYMSDSSVHNF